MIKPGWSFDKSSGFTGSAAADKIPVRAHERSVQCFAKGGKVEAKPAAKPQKHFDRMENFRKERDAEPAPPANNQKAMKRGGNVSAHAVRIAKERKGYAEGGAVSKALAKDSTLGIPGGDGTKNVVGMKKGGKAKGKSGGKSSAAAQQKAAGALAQIAAATQGGGPIAGAPGGMAAPPAGLPGMGGPPGMPPGMPGMKRGGKASKKK